MQTIDKTHPVLVTGASGYIASWIVKKLLAEGITVHATVRDPANAEKVGHLTSLEKAEGADLKLFAADLLTPGSFDEAVQGCQLVMHTASPFFISKPKDPQAELLQPAREGTRNVLEAANKTPTVKRIVLTSSVVAIYGDNVDIEQKPGGIFTEEDWNSTSNADLQPYPYSKTIAEKEAWAIAGAQNQWDLVVLNPALVFGPSVSSRTDSMSISTMIQFGDGTYRLGVPELWNSIVDVRDVATAHIKAGYTPQASGRHILSSGETTLLDIGKTLRHHFGDAYPFPRMQAPKHLFWLIAPLYDVTRKFVSKNVGYRLKMDNSYSKEDLGMEYIPIEQTVKDHFQQLLDDGLVKTVSKKSYK